MTVAALFLLASIAGAPSPRTIVDDLFQAFNRHDVRALQPLYAPDAKLTSSDFCTPRTGADVTRTYRAIFRSAPDIRDDVTSVVVGRTKPSPAS